MTEILTDAGPTAGDSTQSQDAPSKPQESIGADPLLGKSKVNQMIVSQDSNGREHQTILPLDRSHGGQVQLREHLSVPSPLAPSGRDQ